MVIQQQAQILSFGYAQWLNKIQDGRRITCYSQELACFTDLLQGSNHYHGHMLIRFWCDSDITFPCGLHKNLVTVLYFSIINVLCGAGGDTSFAPQANLVYKVMEYFSSLKSYFIIFNSKSMIFLCNYLVIMIMIIFSLHCRTGGDSQLPKLILFQKVTVYS